MNSRPVLVASLAILMVVLVAIVIVVPAELMFRWSTGTWYGSERASKANLGEKGDFRLYRHSFALQKTPGRIRILTVGGSTTYGMSVQAGDTWPERLAQKLNKSYPGRFEVINVAYLGGHLEGFISDYHRVSHRYIPRDRWLEGERPNQDDMAKWGWQNLESDILIVVPIVNDTAPDFVFMREHGDIAIWTRRAVQILDTAPVIRNLAISHYLKVVIWKLSHGNGNISSEVAYGRIRESYQTNLERFVSLWGRDTRVFIIGLPWLFNADDSPDMLSLAMKVWGVGDRQELADELSYFPALENMEAEVRRTVARKYTDHSIVTAEIGRDLKAHPFRERLHFYLDPIHVNAEGYELFAKEIYQMVVSTQMADRPLKPH